MSAEHQRLQEGRQQNIPWRKWGPYLSERQWGDAAAPNEKQETACLSASHPYHNINSGASNREWLR
jgi:hypothetical protein